MLCWVIEPSTLTSASPMLTVYIWVLSLCEGNVMCEQYHVWVVSIWPITAESLVHNLFQIDTEYRKIWDHYAGKLEIIDRDPEGECEVLHWIMKYPVSILKSLVKINILFA